MFDHAQRELNELLEIVHKTATICAGLQLDPTASRSDAAMQEHARMETRKAQLMEKYNLTDNQAYRQRNTG